MRISDVNWLNGWFGKNMVAAIFYRTSFCRLISQQAGAMRMDSELLHKLNNNDGLV
jgi:hypothetical protein